MISKFRDRIPRVINVASNTAIGVMFKMMEGNLKRKYQAPELKLA
jgi:hypothetical protein